MDQSLNLDKAFQKPRWTAVAFLLLGCVLATPVYASQNPTLVRKVIGKASAAPNTTLPAGSEFTTGSKSKSELLVNRGTVRVGENANIETTSKGGLVLRQGVTVVASDPTGIRKTIDVRAPGYRLKVKGTAQVAFDPGHSLKVVVLEGTVTVSLDSLTGEFETLQPGQLLVINPSDNRLPEPVEVDLQRLVATSQLIGGPLGELSTSGKFGTAVSSQSVAYTRGDLVTTPLLLRGLEVAVQVQEEQRRLAARSAPSAQRVEQTIFNNNVNDLDNPNAVVRTKLYKNGQPQLPIEGPETLLTRDGGARTKQLKVLLQGVYEIDENTGEERKVTEPSLSGKIRVAPNNFAGTNKLLEFATVVPEDRLQITPGADIQSPANVGLKFSATGMDINGAVLQAGSAKRSNESVEIRTRADANIVVSKVHGGGNVTIAGTSTENGAQALTLDNSTATSGRRSVVVGLPTVRAAITIRNSSELAALAGMVAVASKGAPISISDSSLRAKEINIDSGDPVDRDTQGLVTIRNAQLAAESIRIRSFSPSGDALIIDGSRFGATQFIKLYAEGTSTLRFRNSVTFDSPLTELAGKIVEVESGGKVVMSGKGVVFTDTANFNKDGFGSMKSDGGSSNPDVQEFDKRSKPR